MTFVFTNAQVEGQECDSESNLIRFEVNDCYLAYTN